MMTKRGPCGRKLLGLVVAGLVLGAATEAAAEERIALVVGNSKYLHTSPLANPANDARLIAAALRRVGFRVTERLDLDQKALKRSIVEFGEKLAKAGDQGIGLFYYAGHGVQVGGRNYLIPVDARINSEAEVDIEAVPADSVLAQMDHARARLNFVVLDACRNNPFARSFRSASRGLAVMDAPRGTLIAYATAPGDVAADGADGNSPYAAALAETLGSAGVQAEEMFRAVRRRVMQATGEKQTPWESSSLTNAFYFGTAGAVASSPVAPAPAPAARSDAEILFWQSVKDSRSPADYRAYLEAFPDGTFAPLARSRIVSLSAPREAVPEGNDGVWNGWLRTYGGLFDSPVEATFTVTVTDGRMRGTVDMYGQTRTIEGTVAADGTLVGGRIVGRNSYNLHGTIQGGTGDGAALGWKLEYRMSRKR